jgi:hypothetical protein
MEKIHVRNMFRLLVPLNRNLGSSSTRTQQFGIDFFDLQCSFNIKLVGTDHFGNIKHEPENCFTWAKRNPVIFQQDAQNNVIGMFIQFKINQGVFDFRRTKDRLFQIIVEFTESGSVTKTGTSRILELFPKRRYYKTNEDESETVVPIYWLGEDGYLIDAQEQDISPAETSSISPNGSSQYVTSSGQDPERSRYVSSEGEYSPSIHDPFFGDAMLDAESPSDENQLSRIMTHIAEYDVSNSRPNDTYMVLYNGNAEVVGNFRALNFYKASDINIKEDIRLLEEDRDCRASLLQINGVEYKFKQGVSHSTNKRFIGYIAQQIESVVPEAVQLIDGILHVDYESLIPYLSESIKQNYIDIQYVTSEVVHIQQVIDSLYEQFTGVKFTGMKQKPEGETAKSEAKTNTKKKVTGWVIGAIALSAIIASIVIGFTFITAQTRNAPAESPGSLVPITILSPSSKHPRLEHLSPANYERGMLVELYNSLWAYQFDVKWNFTAPHCSWHGITCNTTTGRVIEIYFWSVTFPYRRAGSVGSPTIPEVIGNFTDLAYLFMRDAYITSTIPESIKNLKNLTSLVLAGNQLVGTLPDLSGLNKLKEVDLEDTSLSLNESSLAMLVQLPSISVLRLSSVPINAQLPSNFTKSLSDLRLSNCILYGTIPKSWEDSNLLYLDISQNKLNGSIPCIGKTIITLIASKNDFDGEFCGSEFGSHLLEFDLADTNLTGVFDLPHVDMYHVIRLNVPRNRFTSFMPSAVNETEGPQYCFAAGNPLQCPIPEWSQTQCAATCN